MTDTRKDQDRATPYIPPKVAPPEDNPSTVDNSTKVAEESPDFQKALAKDDERERAGLHQEDRDAWDRTGAGPGVEKTDPMTSQEREASKAQREVGY
ncbi:hypothetical protein VARIO8X_90511 [Burkholderiales bacterium 8X]|nr:hypothetical protein VARIO8X_90511 [Burkholderiales bacterium 8X]